MNRVKNQLCITENKEFINTFLNNLIIDVYNEVLKLENNAENLNTIHRSDLNTIKNYQFKGGISIINTVPSNNIVHVNNYMIIVNKLNIDSNHMSISINNILNHILNTNTDYRIHYSTVPPFVILNVNLEHLHIHYDEYIINFENAYLNITTPNMEEGNLKIVKFKYEKNIYIVLFFDIYPPLLFGDNTICEIKPVIALINHPDYVEIDVLDIC